MFDVSTYKSETGMRYNAGTAKRFGFMGNLAAMYTYIIASGGTETRNGDWIRYTFTSSGNFTIAQISNNPAFNLIKIIGVAGGGSARQAAGSGYGEGGGGGGGVAENLSFDATSFIGVNAIVVGAGASFGASNGSNTTALGLTFLGGGQGGYYNQGATSGGSGGGASGAGGEPLIAPGSGTLGQGNNGGTGLSSFPSSPGGGGGGGGQAGAAGTISGGGKGGDGYLSTITGSYYGGGGGGGARAVAAGAGGLGGGGNGGSNVSGASTAGTANTGGGAGGTLLSQLAGGSGIVVIEVYSPL